MLSWQAWYDDNFSFVTSTHKTTEGDLGFNGYHIYQFLELLKHFGAKIDECSDKGKT